MILRRYGARIESVEPNFDARALNEIGFRRTGTFSEDADAFFQAYEKADSHELTADAEGEVKDVVEQALLAALLGDLNALDARTGTDELVLVESEPGKDYPKTRDVTRTKVVHGENRLYFEYRVEPPLRLAVYRKRAG